MLRGERFWQAHRTHYYQRLVQLGWGHRKTALAEYALMLSCGSASLVALGRPVYLQAAVIAAICVLIASLGLWTDKRWRSAGMDSIETR
jgi:hypothetical protein